MEHISIGNDIVDLNSEEPELHARYVDRVFSPKEKIFTGTDRQKLWLLWSAKEAAYKAIKRLSPGTIFSPISFEYDPDLQLINFQNIFLHCKHLITKDYVYTFCATQKDLLKNNSMHNWIRDITDEDSTKKPVSIYVREVATQNIAQSLNIPQSDIKISVSSSTSKDSIPRLFINGLESQDLISFSHHGRFVACLHYNL